MAESIPNWLLQRAYLTPNRVGLIFNGEKWTFAEMANQIHTVAKRLDIREGERIAVLLKNTPDAVWIIHALQQYGAETVFLNNRLTIPELLFQVEDSESKNSYLTMVSILLQRILKIVQKISKQFVCKN